MTTLISITDATRISRLSRERLYFLIAHGKLTAFLKKVSGSPEWFIDADELEWHRIDSLKGKYKARP